MITYLKFTDLEGTPEEVLTKELREPVKLQASGMDLKHVIVDNTIIGEVEKYNNYYFFIRYGEEVRLD